MRKFRKRDKVRCVGNSVKYVSSIAESEQMNYGGAGWELNKIYIIDRVTEEYFPGRYICWTTDNRGVWNTHLELVEREKKIIKEFGIVKFCRENYE